MKQFLEQDIENAQKKFGALIRSEEARISRMEESGEPLDFTKLDSIIVGIMPGDGIGPILMPLALQTMKELVGEEITSGKIVLKNIEGMTIENRVVKLNSLPEECLEEIKTCHVLLKGPMMTPRAGDGLPNLVSANSMLRRSLDLYAAVRPIDIKEKNIHWTFFRENIEGEYIWGNKGIQVDEDLAVDFKVQTKRGTERLARAAFEHARKNGKKNVTIVTKANIVKLVDGNFIEAVRRVGKEYPDIEIQERLVDAMCAKMLDPDFNKGIEVVVLPNLYGDIVTDVAAEHQGGLGTASSSNIGDRYALFEAIHGTGPYLIGIGKGHCANPCSLIRAMGQMLVHMGYADRNALLEQALDLCTTGEGAMEVGFQEGQHTAAEFTEYLIDTIRKIRK
ncbi:MAG: isocitrate/isopropylmalate dehydrogenase family protein [Clostridiales bacterium]|nr:isocitrate/isopropylmalate dehydrogenase family protein [Clostridiales bacterium]